MATKRATEISGWYAKNRLSEAERAEEIRRVTAWHRRKFDLNYRPIACDLPGKAVLALGQMAQERGIPFGEMIEGILLEYLERHGISWQE